MTQSRTVNHGRERRITNRGAVVSGGALGRALTAGAGEGPR